jgi:hypothetical protein
MWGARFESSTRGKRAEITSFSIVLCVPAKCNKRKYEHKAVLYRLPVIMHHPSLKRHKV